MESPAGGTHITELRGQRLGPYELVELIGRGGMAVVYRALQPALRRHVAIKVLPAYFVHEEDFLARFQKEAELVAHLEHPNILPIYDFGQEGTVPYIVMPLVSGGTFRDWLRQGPTMERTVRVFSHLLSALEYAHTRERPIVHRDLKPGNVLMGHGDWPLLTDFGIAKIVEPSGGLTRSGMMLVGTPEYMAPEQSEGRAVDHRADVYAMGVMLFEVLTGRVPFEGQTPISIILQHVQSQVPSPRTINRELSPTWDEVIARSMAKSPADRYQSARAMDEAIQAAWRQASGEAGTGRLAGTADPHHLYQSAARALAAGEWLQVVSLCGQLLEIDPAHPEAVQLLTQAHQALRRQRTAQAPATPTPRPRPARTLLGPPVDTPGSPSVAAGASPGASDGQPPALDSLYQEACADIAAERWDAAAAKLDALAQTAPDYRDVAMLRRDVAMQQRRETQLAAWYAEAVAAEARRDWPEAIAAFQQLLGEASTYRDAAARLVAAEQEFALKQALVGARATLAIGHAPEAVALLETLARAAPESAEAKTLLAEARAHLASPPTRVRPADASASGVARPAPLVQVPAGASAGPPSAPQATPAADGPSAQPEDHVPVAAPSVVAQANGGVAGQRPAAETPRLVASEGRPATASVATGSQLWKLVLVMVPLALAVVAFLGFQRLASAPGAPRDAPGAVALATPAELVAPAPTAASVSAPATVVPTPTIADLFVPCEEAIKGADWTKAATACEQVRARDAEHPPLAAALATTYLALGKEQLAQGGGIAAALRYFEHAVDAQPDDPEAQQQLQRAVAYREGSSALAAENWPGATEKLEAVYAVAPDYLEAAGEDGAKSKLFLALLKWGEALLRDGHFAEAKQRCEQALELVPESEPAKACGAAATAALATPIPQATPLGQPPRTQPQAQPPRTQPQAQPQAQPPRPQPQAQPQPAPQSQPQARPQPQPQAQPPARPQPQAAPAAPALPTRPAAPPVMAPPTRSPY